MVDPHFTIGEVFHVFLYCRVLVWSAKIMVLMCSPTLIRVSVSLALWLSTLLSIIMGLLMGFVGKGLSSDLFRKSLVTQRHSRREIPRHITAISKFVSGSNPGK